MSANRQKSEERMAVNRKFVWIVMMKSQKRRALKSRFLDAFGRTVLGSRMGRRLCGRPYVRGHRYVWLRMHVCA